MLVTQQLQFSYPNLDLSFPDITVKPNQPLLILGESGKGKTTLLNLIGGLITPSSGSILVDETDITQLSSSQLDRFRGKNISFVFQKSHFVQSLSVFENLKAAMHYSGSKIDTKKIETVAESLNIQHLLNKKTHHLSQGEQQRASIARAVINQPKLILADEPTAALDDKNCNAVVQLLSEQSAELGAALIIVTHDQRVKDAFQNQIQL